MIVKAKHTGKWVTHVAPEDSIAVAAEVTLKPRLKAVTRYLKLAATCWREDVEHVHELRVHSRRCLAAIEMYKEVLPKRRRRQLQRWLVKIRRAAGEARDLDVLLAKCRQANREIWPLHLVGDGVTASDQSNAIARCCKVICRRIKRRRRKAQKPIQKLYQRLIESGRLQKWSKRLWKSISRKKASRQPPFERWAQDRFADAVECLNAATPKPGASLAKWHRFRIRGKQLRYTMELVAAVYDREFRTELYVCVSELQDRLGSLTDHVTAFQYLSTFRRRFKKGPEAKPLKAMICREQEQFAVTLVQFQSWWMVDAEARFKSLFERYR